MSVSPALARRIDRLARRAHRFHRFAHHPLCGRYRGELLVLGGRARVCRGCTSSLLALLAGVLYALVCVLPVVPLVAASVVCLGVLTGSLFRASDFQRARASKLWTRAVPAFTLSATITSLLRVPAAPHLALAASFTLACAVWLARYRRRGPDRSPCLHCPEYALPGPCSGFREIVRAERAFTRRAQQLMDAAGPTLSP